MDQSQARKLVEQAKANGGFVFQGGGGNQPPPQNYTPGHSVHFIHARKAIGDPRSFEKVALTRVASDCFTVIAADAASLPLPCVEAVRLKNLIAATRETDSGSRPIETEQGIIAMLSRRWHMLVVPVGPKGATMPRRMAIPLVFQMTDGVAEETAPCEEGISFMMFNVRLEPQA